MANEGLALADISVGLPQDTDYDAVYAAVTATERGRWFLTEYASRNRHTETDAVVGAIARIEAAIRGDRPAPDQLPTPDIGAAVEKIGDIAVEMRERSTDANLCDALDAAVRELWKASGAPLNIEEAGGGGLQDNEMASVPAAPEVRGAEMMETPAPLAAAPHEFPAEQPPAEEAAPQEPTRTLVPSQDFAPSFEAVAVNGNGRRWHIEAPDFVFMREQPVINGARQEERGEQELPVNGLADNGLDESGLGESGLGESGLGESGLGLEGLTENGLAANGPVANGSAANGLGVERLPEERFAEEILAETNPSPAPQPLLADPEDDPADLFDQTQPVTTPATSVTFEMPAPVSSAAVQLHTANGTVIAVALRPAPPDPLAPLRALSEEETIALFG